MLVKRNKLFYLRYLFVPIVTVITICSSIVGMINYSPTTLATTGVPGNPAFDDINFYTCVLKRLDTMNAKKNSTDPIGYNGRIAEGAEVYSATDYELGLIDDLNCSGRDKADGLKITSAKGLNKLVGLNRIHLIDNRLTSIDVTKNVALVFLCLDYNRLTSINLTKNTALEWISLADNQLTGINLTYNTKLTDIYLDTNQLASINLSENTNLEWLSLAENPITSLDLSKNKELGYLLVGDVYPDALANKIESLDLSANKKLAELYLVGLYNLKSLIIGSTNTDFIKQLVDWDYATYRVVWCIFEVSAPNLKVIKVTGADRSENKAVIYQQGNISKVDINTTVGDVFANQLASIHLGFTRFVLDTPTIKLLSSSPKVTNSSGALLNTSNVFRNGDLIKGTYLPLSGPNFDEDEVDDLSFTLPIAVNGDVASDGAIKLGDIIKLYRHYRKREVMTSEVLLAAGDVNSDGDITLGDVIQLYRYFRGRIGTLS